jgi:hypothetical protein
MEPKKSESQSVVRELKKAGVTEPVKEGIKWFLASGCTLLVVYAPPVYAWLKLRLPFWLLLAIAGIEFLTGSVLLSYIFYLRKKIKSLVPNLFFRFGIQWDQELQPYCPKCAQRLEPYRKTITGQGLRCHTCRWTHALVAEDGSGRTLTWNEAIAQLPPRAS